ncbi:hypothetical protein FIE12Z_6828 [Fusarium flagelliforme]|uniref:Uncharacterized protein n=1 Tax=Fusarium flagelliforme TaxID=2675880 RepID=A0A395MMD4_9HYPO|nr:hypothetical protein FIE12Z_6828 [Fusarium flagelliforme]
MPDNWSQSPGTSDSSRSAFLIDGGLWRACKESREAIAKHTRFYNWARVHEQAIAIDPLDNCRGDWAGGDNSTHPAFIETCEGEEQCRVLVYPHRDIFCIQVDDWKSLQRGIFDSDLEMTFVHSNSHCVPPRIVVANIAVKFDDSWLENIPNCLSRLQGEISARGFFGSLLLEYHRNLGYLDALWIIDKDAWWYDTLSQDHDTVYRDGDEEYVEVDWSHIVHFRPSASTFMKKIDGFLIDYPGLGGLNYPSNLRPRDVFRLLVRRDHGENSRFNSPLGQLYPTEEFVYAGDLDRKDGGSEDGDEDGE